MIYIAEVLTFKPQINNPTQLFEHVLVDVKAEGKTIAVNCLYRPPIDN